MKRLELFEFEDFNWLPSVIRSGITNLLIVFHRLMGSSEVIANLIGELRSKHNFNQIVDLGSGSGGAMFDVIKKVNEGEKDQPLELLLSDYYPNADVVGKINKQQIPHVKYHESSMDATNIGEAPEGLKTMIASFHHMAPEKAKQILLSAQENKQPILIYEVAKNNIPTLLWWIFLPISLVILIVMSLVMTLFVRPLSLSQLLFTYIIPIIPIIYAWDGQASLMQMPTLAWI